MASSSLCPHLLQEYFKRIREISETYKSQIVKFVEYDKIWNSLLTRKILRFEEHEIILRLPTNEKQMNRTLEIFENRMWGLENLISVLIEANVDSWLVEEMFQKYVHHIVNEIRRLQALKSCRCFEHERRSFFRRAVVRFFEICDQWLFDVGTSLGCLSQTIYPTGNSLQAINNLLPLPRSTDEPILPSIDSAPFDLSYDSEEGVEITEVPMEIEAKAANSPTTSKVSTIALPSSGDLENRSVKTRSQPNSPKPVQGKESQREKTAIKTSVSLSKPSRASPIRNSSRDVAKHYLKTSPTSTPETGGHTFVTMNEIPSFAQQHQRNATGDSQNSSLVFVPMHLNRQSNEISPLNEINGSSSSNYFVFQPVPMSSMHGVDVSLYKSKGSDQLHSPGNHSPAWLLHDDSYSLNAKFNSQEMSFNNPELVSPTRRSLNHFASHVTGSLTDIPEETNAELNSRVATPPLRQRSQSHSSLQNKSSVLSLAAQLGGTKSPVPGSLVDREQRHDISSASSLSSRTPPAGSVGKPLTRVTGKPKTTVSKPSVSIPTSVTSKPAVDPNLSSPKHSAAKQLQSKTEKKPEPVVTQTKKSQQQVLASKEPSNTSKSSSIHVKNEASSSHAHSSSENINVDLNTEEYLSNDESESSDAASYKTEECDLEISRKLSFDSCSDSDNSLEDETETEVFNNLEAEEIKNVSSEDVNNSFVLTQGAAVSTPVSKPYEVSDTLQPSRVYSSLEPELNSTFQNHEMNHISFKPQVTATMGTASNLTASSGISGICTESKSELTHPNTLKINDSTTTSLDNPSSEDNNAESIDSHILTPHTESTSFSHPKVSQISQRETVKPMHTTNMHNTVENNSLKDITVSLKIDPDSTSSDFETIKILANSKENLVAISEEEDTEKETNSLKETTVPLKHDPANASDFEPVKNVAKSKENLVDISINEGTEGNISLKENTVPLKNEPDDTSSDVEPVKNIVNSRENMVDISKNEDTEKNGSLKETAKLRNDPDNASDFEPVKNIETSSQNQVVISKDEGTEETKSVEEITVASKIDPHSAPDYEPVTTKNIENGRESQVVICKNEGSQVNESENDPAKSSTVLPVVDTVLQNASNSSSGADQNSASFRFNSCDTNITPTPATAQGKPKEVQNSSDTASSTEEHPSTGKTEDTSPVVHQQDSDIGSSQKNGSVTEILLNNSLAEHVNPANPTESSTPEKVVESELINVEGDEKTKFSKVEATAQNSQMSTNDDESSLSSPIPSTHPKQNSPKSKDVVSTSNPNIKTPTSQSPITKNVAGDVNVVRVGKSTPSASNSPISRSPQPQPSSLKKGPSSSALLTNPKGPKGKSEVAAIQSSNETLVHPLKKPAISQKTSKESNSSRSTSSSPNAKKAISEKSSATQNTSTTNLTKKKSVSSLNREPITSDKSVKSPSTSALKKTKNDISNLIARLTKPTTSSVRKYSNKIDKQPDEESKKKSPKRFWQSPADKRTVASNARKSVSTSVSQTDELPRSSTPVVPEKSNAVLIPTNGSDDEYHDDNVNDDSNIKMGSSSTSEHRIRSQLNLSDDDSSMCSVNSSVFNFSISDGQLDFQFDIDMMKIRSERLDHFFDFQIPSSPYTPILTPALKNLTTAIISGRRNSALPAPIELVTDHWIFTSNSNPRRCRSEPVLSSIKQTHHFDDFEQRKEALISPGSIPLQNGSTLNFKDSVGSVQTADSSNNSASTTSFESHKARLVDASSQTETKLKTSPTGRVTVPRSPMSPTQRNVSSERKDVSGVSTTTTRKSVSSGNIATKPKPLTASNSSTSKLSMSPSSRQKVATVTPTRPTWNTKKPSPIPPVAAERFTQFSVDDYNFQQWANEWSSRQEKKKNAAENA